LANKTISFNRRLKFSEERKEVGWFEFGAQHFNKIYHCNAKIQITAMVSTKNFILANKAISLNRRFKFSKEQKEVRWFEFCALHFSKIYHGNVIIEITAMVSTKFYIGK
jgi:hypothetical protein